MDMTKSSQYNLIMLKRHALFVMFICYIPHILTEPWWLFVIFLSAIAYRLIADYFNYSPLSRWTRFVLVMGALLLLGTDIHSSQIFISFLLIFIILKCCLENQTQRDLKVLVLCNFFIIFAALIVVQELWIIIYLCVALFANLSIMLKLSATQINLREIGSKTSQQLLIVIPLSILLFYIFPRINPLWQVLSLSKSARSGFSETMRVGSIADMFNDYSTFMQITFKNKPILSGYWKGIILSYYTGESWHSSQYNYVGFFPLQELKPNEAEDYEILLEPSQTKWLFYEGYPVAGKSNLLFSPNHGLIQQNKEINRQRIAYSLKIQSEPYHVLKPAEYNEATQLPYNIDPRLNAWAKEQFKKTNNNIPVFIAFLHDYIHEHSFWYTLSPPALSVRDQMDNFWFDTQKGFCEHYVSAMAFILRSVGIPARVVVGFQGGQWNPFAHAIIIQRKDAHAWLEYWQEAVGWQRLDPTSFIAPERIDQTIRSRQNELLSQENYFTISELPWGQKVKYFLESAQFFSERWFLFYNQNSQQNLLKYVGLEKWDKQQLLESSVACAILFFILLGFYYHWQERREHDFLLREYHLLQKEFRRFNISIDSTSTLKQQCKLLIDKVPHFAPVLSSFLDNYELLRLKQAKKNEKETVALFKALRYTLRQHKN